MYRALRFALLCVALQVFISPVHVRAELLDLDISDPSQQFQKTSNKYYDQIVLSSESSSSGNCVGKVTDASETIIEAGDSSVKSRFVRIIKVPKDESYNPDLDLSTQEVTLDQQSTNIDYDPVVQVHSYFGKALMLDLYMKKQDGKYGRFNYQKVDVNVCVKLDTVDVGTKKYFKVDNFKTVGKITCGDRLLLDSLNVAYRNIEVRDKSVVVSTTPRFGFASEVEYFIQDQKYAVTKRSVRTQLSLDIKTPDPKCAMMYSECGTDCMFYEGCSGRYTLVDIHDDKTLIYKNPRTFCLCVKVEVVRDQTYLTIYDRHRNSDSFNVKFYKLHDKDLMDVNKNPVKLDVSDVEDIKPVDPGFNKMLKKHVANESVKAVISDVEYIIGNLFFNGTEILPAGVGLHLREVYSRPDGVLVHDQYPDGSTRRHLFKLVPPKQSHQSSSEGGEEDEEGSGGQSKPPAKLESINENVLKLDLDKLTTHVTMYMTHSQDHLVVRPKSFVDKIGSLFYRGNVFCPNRFFVARQYLIMDVNSVKLHAITRRGNSFYESFVKVKSIVGDKDVYVSKAKDVKHFDVTAFYQGLVDKNLTNFTDFDINNLGDYYLVTTSYRHLYEMIMGHVYSGTNILAPFDPDLTARFVILPKNTQSFVVIKDCDAADCWEKLYLQTCAKGKLGYKLQHKKELDLKLEELIDFKNDKPLRGLEGEENSSKRFVMHRQYKVFTIRVRDELRNKIGKVTFNSRVIAEDIDHVYTRMVNVSVDKDPSTNKVKGNLRVLDVQKWDKSTKLFTYELDNGTVTINEAPKTDIELDLEPTVRNNTNLNITHRNDVLSYSLNWNNRDDYSLTKIKCSHPENNDWVPHTLKDDLDKYPLFVRLHKLDDPSGGASDKKYVLAVENHAECKRPTTGQFFKTESNAANKGMLLQYDANKKKTEAIGSYPQDAYHRRNYTNHRHAFELEQSGSITSAEGSGATGTGDTTEAHDSADVSPSTESPDEPTDL